jgi:hypothetical protein
MFKTIKQKLLSIISDNHDTWAGNMLPVRYNPPCQEPEQQPLRILPPQPQDTLDTPATPNIQDMRTRLIHGEAYEEIQSTTRHRVHIVRATSDLLSSEEKRSFTDEGLVAHSEQYFLHTADGRFITGPELHGGGQCSICQGYTDEKQLCFCAVCRRPLCFACARSWQELEVCPTHFRRLQFNRDAWVEGA